jgi:hypothetical protein
MSDSSYCKGIKKLIPKNAHEYKRLMDVFAGGYTHANRYYSGEVQKGNIKHFDFASSYPSVMVSEKFPMKPWEYVFNNNLPTKEQMDKYAYILHLRFKNIKSKTSNHNFYWNGEYLYYVGKQIRIKVQMSDVDGIYTRTLTFPKKRSKNNFEWENGLNEIVDDILALEIGDKLIAKHLRDEESICIITRIE